MQSCQGVTAVNEAEAIELLICATAISGGQSPSTCDGEEGGSRGLKPAVCWPSAATSRRRQKACAACSLPPECRAEAAENAGLGRPPRGQSQTPFNTHTIQLAGFQSC